MNAIKSKRSNISPFLAIDMLTRANKLKSKGKDIIHMDVGEPGFNTPMHILKYAKTIIEEKKVGYTEAIGIPELREKIVAKIRPIRRPSSSNNPRRSPIKPVVIIKKIASASRN